MFLFQKVGRLLDREVEVEDFVVDFEAAMWKAIRRVWQRRPDPRLCLPLGSGSLAPSAGIMFSKCTILFTYAFS